MKQRIILFGLILVGTVTFAQSPEEKGLNTINRSSAEATIGFLASDELQGREAGFHGSYVSSEYIASILQWMGIQPLNESYFQSFDAYRKERQKKGRLEVHPDSVAKLKQEVHQKLSMRNVLAMIPGKNLGCIADCPGISCKRTTTGAKCNLCLLGRRRKGIARF